MSPPPKRCLYEVLNLPQDCTENEIRSAFRKLALQRHPDKLIASGVPETAATASFQELVHAYEVLSDPNERSWYDNHRSQYLADTDKSVSGTGTGTGFFTVPDLFSVFGKKSGGGGKKVEKVLDVDDLLRFLSNDAFSGFGDTGKGFYKVYGDLFDRVFRNELRCGREAGVPVGTVKDAPKMGNATTPYKQVNAFYDYWLGFDTVMDFSWLDFDDAGLDGKLRKEVEEENKKARKKARREYNETVRDLVKFVKKRDKRMIEIEEKRRVEMERKKEEKRKEMEREKAEKARAYQEPEWAKVEEVEYVEEEVEEGGGERKEFYCIACGKTFKSDKQWKNHEQSKKHKEKAKPFIKKGMQVLEERSVKDDAKDESQSAAKGFVVTGNGEGLKGVAVELGSDDHDHIREPISARQRKGVGVSSRSTSSKKDHIEIENNIRDIVIYNSPKGYRRKEMDRVNRGRIFLLSCCILLFCLCAGFFLWRNQ